VSNRVLFFVVLLIASWCVMTVVHESGHVVCGWLGGGKLQEADLRPWSLPHSRFAPDPHPLLTVWGGPVLGVLVPVVVAVAVRQRWMWFIANFCILANGLYLAVAWFSGEQHLDTARLLQNGAYPISIAVFCVATISVGYLGFRRECIRMLSGSDRDGDSKQDAEQSLAAESR